MQSRAEYPIQRLVVACGIASVTTQLVVVRELLSQFQGNEMVIALVFFNWLLLSGVGTRLAYGRPNAALSVLTCLSLTLAALSTGQIIAIRLLRPVLFPMGASVGLYPVVAFSFLVMAPYAVMMGFVLPYSLYVLRRENRDFPSARLYIADNLGDVCGGALFSFLLVYWCTPMLALMIANIPLLAATWPLLPVPWLRNAGTATAMGILLLGLFFEAASLEPAVGKLIHYQESRYGRLTLHQHQKQISLFADGRPAFTSQDSAMAEEMVHYPLSQIHHPGSILLISMASGMLEEVVKYRPSRVDYIELDATISDLLQKYHLMPDVAGVNIIHSDARKWLHSSSQKYDAILLNISEPTTYQLNRFFTDGFFEIVKNHLTPQGIYCFSVEGFANYMTDPQREKISSLKNTAARHFSHIGLLPGLRFYFLCKQTPIDNDIPARLQHLSIETRYAGPYYSGNITPERQKGVHKLLDAQVPLNTDDRPYLMRVVFSQWLNRFGHSPIGLAIVLALGLGLYLLRLRRQEVVLFTTGLVTMGSEFLVVFAFQIYFGYIYLKIGVIVTMFLAGLLPGAWLGHRCCKRSTLFLPASDLGFIMMMGAMTVALAYFGACLSEYFFYASGFLISFICGFQFPLAASQLGDTNRTASRIFSADLIGAATAALVVSTLLIPYFGLGATAGVLMAIKVLSLGVMGVKYGLDRSAGFSGG